MSAPWIAAYGVLWVAVIALVLIVLGLLRRVGGVLEQAEARLAGADVMAEKAGAAPGTTIDAFTVEDLDGGLIASEQLLERTTVLAFMEEGCAPCEQLARAMTALTLNEDGHAELVVVSKARPANGGLPIPPGIAVVIDHAQSATNAFHNHATPQAYLVGADRRVVERLFPRDIEDLRRLQSMGLSAEGRPALAMTHVNSAGGRDRSTP